MNARRLTLPSLVLAVLLGQAACAQRTAPTAAAPVAGGGTAAPPAITAVSPSSGPTGGGTVVTVTGTGFAAGATAALAGGAVVGLSVVSATNLTFATPPGTIGPATLVVANPSGQSATAPNAFWYVAPAPPPPPPPAAPTVTAVSPTSGPTAGGTTITVTGTGFATGATLALGGAAATSVTVVLATSLTGVTPAGVAGAVAVTVTNPGGVSGSRASGFTYVSPAPTILSVSPTSGPPTGGTKITVTGTGFASGATLQIGTAFATSVSVVSATTMTGVTAGGASGTWPVLVLNPGGSFGMISGGFTYTTTALTPAITFLSPDRGSPAGGSVVTITGSGFATGATLQFRGVAATAVTVATAGRLVCTTPAGGLGGAPVDVTNPGGATGTHATGWTYVLGILATGTSPPSGPTTGGTVVTLSGYGFQAGATVAFNGILSPAVTVLNEYTAIVVSPQCLPGWAAVAITNPTAVTGTPTPGYGAQASTVIRGFHYAGTGILPGPTAPVVPIEGPSAGGYAVTLTGAGFQTGATVTFGGLPATGVTVVGSGTLTCVAPRAPAGASPVVAVVAINPDGSTWTAAPPSAGFVYRRVQVDTTTGNSFRPDVAPDGNGGVHVVWTESATGSQAIQHRRSTDNGRTWSATTILAAVTTGTWGPSLSYPVVAVRGTDVFVAWIRSDWSATLGAPRGLPWFASSTDGGVTFGTAAQLGSFAGLNGSWLGTCDVAIATSGTVVVVAEETITGGNTVVSSSTGSVGGQFGSPVRVSPAASTAVTPRVAVVGATGVHVAWLDQQTSSTPGTRDAYVASSGDGGATFGNPSRLTTHGLAESPSVAANASRVIVGWATSASLNAVTTVASTDAGKTFGAASTVSGGQSVWPGWGAPRLALDGGQTVVATFVARVSIPNTGGAHQEIFVARSNDGGATWGTAATVTDFANLRTGGVMSAAFPSVRCAGGTFVVVWSDGSLASGSRFQIAAY